MGLLAVTLWKRLRAPVWVRLLLLGLCCLLAYPANWNYIAVLWIFGFAVFRESPKKRLTSAHAPAILAGQNKEGRRVRLTSSVP